MNASKSLALLFLFLGACGGPDMEGLDDEGLGDAEDALHAGIVDPCIGFTTGYANYTLFMGSNITTRKQSIPVASYPPVIGACGGHVSVQIDVPSYSSGYGNTSDTIEVAVGLYSFDRMVASIDSDFPVPDPLFNDAQQRCLGYNVFGSIYYRGSVRTQFTRVQTFNLVGQWISGNCRIRDATSGNVGYVVRSLTPPSSGTAQYRVVFGGTLEGAREDVRIRARHPQL